MTGETIRILMIEDNADFVETVKAGLAHEMNAQLEWESADSLKKGLRKLDRSSFDIVLLDLRLSDSSGLETLEQVQAEVPHLPIIVISGISDMDLMIEAVRKGVQDFLVKDQLNRQVLARSIRYAIQRKQTEESLRRANEELENRVVARTAQLRNLAGHLQRVREEERTTLAREIHDELGQKLTGLKMDIAWLNKRAAGPPARWSECDFRASVMERMESALNLVDNTIQSVRKISSDLRPGVLDDLGLTAAIEWQAQDFQKRTGITCSCEADEEEIGELSLDQDQATAVFRVFQEILTNVARHAHATRVEINVKKEGGNLCLKVKDNGRGITRAEMEDGKALGLLGMRERAALLGGEVRIEGTPGKGTSVTLLIPGNGEAKR